jgi:predicted AAA+ superfamily ATPase
VKNIVKRELYLEQIRPYMGKPIIKILTGVRRCGKSSIFKMLMDELESSGVSQKNIISFNFDMVGTEELLDGVNLYNHIIDNLSEGMNFVFLDEIQEVSGWEKTVNTLLSDDRTDVYISGSNSKMLSSELSTLLSGGYVQIKVYPLSFAEYLEFRRANGKETSDIHKELNRYLRHGGFPLVNANEFDDQSADKIVFDIYNSILLRDTIIRNATRNAESLERVIRLVFGNIGNQTSVKSISEELAHNRRKVDTETIYGYLDALEKAYLINRVSRYDIRGRDVLRSKEKYYVADLSLVHAITGFRDRMKSGAIENVVMYELLRRGYKVYVGETHTGKDIDFVADRKEKRIYIQVTLTMNEEDTAEREFASLLDIKDNHPKFIVVKEKVWPDNRDGIIQMSLADFLLSDAY